MSPTALSYALKPQEVIWLCVTSAMKFRPPVENRGDPEGVNLGGRPRKLGRRTGTKDSVEKGRVREVAIKFVDGGYPNMTFPQVGEREDVDGGSLRAAVWRVRQERRLAREGAIA